MASIVDLPMVSLVLITSSSNVKEIAFKTDPSASKGEIKRVVESFYGLEVQKVRTLNMKGKKKHIGGSLVAKPDYKKAYVTLKNPLSNLHPLLTLTNTMVADKSKMLAKQC